MALEFEKFENEIEFCRVCETGDTISETTFTETSTPHVDLMGVSPPPEDTRLKTRLLTYVRQRYLNIFLLLVTLVVILSTLLAILVYVQISHPYNLDDVPKVSPPAAESTHPDYQDDATTTENSAEATARLTAEDAADTWLKRKPCQRVKCTNSSCKPKSLDYITMRGYTCCNCYDSHYTFRRFEYDFYRDKVSLVFQVPETITSVSKQDLENMKPLPYLKGMWNKQQESDTAWYYVYEGVTIPDSEEE